MTVAAVVKRIVGRNVVGGASVSFVVHVVAALVAATSAAVKSNTPPPARGSSAMFASEPDRGSLFAASSAPRRSAS